MMQIGNVLIILVLAIVLLLSVIAMIRGYNGMKLSKKLNTSSKKIKFGYWLVSAVHMCMGIIITLCYLIAGAIIINNL